MFAHFSGCLCRPAAARRGLEATFPREDGPAPDACMLRPRFFTAVRSEIVFSLTISRPPDPLQRPFVVGALTAPRGRPKALQRALLARLARPDIHSV